ncbi:hypothetical protein ABT008_09270 [Micromonospora sp. NPDC002389]|uniref:hypothetical protein n=1 Tax=Micromonospora sp. NPDC002389 TaxID=3154272 RepID=UPI00333387F2
MRAADRPSAAGGTGDQRAGLRQVRLRLIRFRQVWLRLIRFRWAIPLAAVLVIAAGCADKPVSPLPVRPPDPTPPSSAASSSPTPPITGAPPLAGPPTIDARPSTSRATRSPSPPSPVPTTRRGTPHPPSPTPTDACLGAVRYDLVLADIGPMPSSLCFATGGVLRIQGIGPGQVTVDRPELADSHYEAGVVDVRFLRSGTVDVTIPHEGMVHVVTVVVR